MTGKKNKTSVLLALLLFIFHDAVAPDFVQLKDTYSILSDEFKQCSPLYGAVWIETGILKKYYKYYATENKPIKDASENAQYFTVKLIQKIFYVVGESLSVTRNVGKPEHYLSPNLIGSIIGIIEKSTIKDKHLLSLSIENLIKQDAQFLQEIKAKTTVDLKNDKAMNVRIKRLANTIVGSLNECDFWTGKSALYPRYMTHAILLACLYKISNEKVDLRKYFNTLNTTAAKNIFTLMGKSIFDQASWNVSTFDYNTLNAIIALCSQQANFPPSKNTLSQLLQFVSNNFKNIDPFEALVCAEINKQFYSKSLPQIIGQNGSQPTFQGHPYSDCAEVALRILCNFVVFDQEKSMFIPVKTENISPSKEIMQYYQADQANAKKHTQPSMYQTWANLLQNIPGIIYTATEFDRRLLGNDLFIQNRAHPCYILLNPTDIQTLKLPKSHKGDFYDLIINQEDYRVVDSTKHKAYAVWQSLKNVIILLNYLLGLKLYDDHLTPFKDTTFCSKYFPLLCKKLGWNFSTPYYQVIYPPAPSLIFNPFSLDTPYLYWCHTIHMSLQDPQTSWDCHIKWHHIEIRNVQTPTQSPLSHAYKQKLYDGLLEGDDSMQTYALLALYATEEQKNKSITNILNTDTVKNRFALYLQNLDALVTEVPVNTSALNALKIAQGSIENPKTKEVKTNTKKTENDLPVRLKQVKGKLVQLRNRLLLLKKMLGDLSKALRP